MKRNNYDIDRDILNLTKSPQLKTNIVYKCNLNFKLIKRYLTKLIQKGFITKTKRHDGKTLYSITNRGLEYLNVFDNLMIA